MLVLFETAAGYAVFKLLNEKKLKHVDNLYHDFESPESASQVVKLKRFQKFKDLEVAVAATTATIEGQISDPLKKLMKKLISSDAQEELAVADAKLGNLIKEKFSIQCVANSNINELMRCIRSQIDSLIGDQALQSMTLGLAHSLSRYKLKFSPDKVDTMIVQAISTLDDIDKEINNYHMRAREWYSWHFPELPKVIPDHDAFIRTVMKLGNKQNASSCDLSDILPEEVEADVKQAAEISMGTEIAELDIQAILHLCKQIVELVEYRTELYGYLKNRMVAIAPNLTVLVGELVGARLIAHAGSLVNLAKHPSSTVQILGAEKALFRALKSKHDTPKYGLIYHASLVGQTSSKYKGKLSRMLAAKCALAIRVDALAETADGGEMGMKNRVKLLSRIQQLENRGAHKISGRGKQVAAAEKYENKSVVHEYNTAADSTLPSVPRKRKSEEDDDEVPAKSPKKVKKEPAVKDESVSEGDVSFADVSESGKKKKKKKKKHLENDDEEEEQPKSKKKIKVEIDGAGDAPVDGESPDVSSGEKKKKKKKKSKTKSEDED